MIWGILVMQLKQLNTVRYWLKRLYYLKGNYRIKKKLNNPTRDSFENIRMPCLCFCVCNKICI